MGAWIEIYTGRPTLEAYFSRTPRWVRGLKSHLTGKLYVGIKSHPTMGAWIEIEDGITFTKSEEVAPHDGCVD